MSGSEALAPRRGETVDHVGVFVVFCGLLACLCQVGLGAQFSESGEQVGLAVPVSTLALLLVWGIQAVRRRLPLLPALSALSGVFLALLSCGVLAANRSELKGVVKELVQLAEIFVLAPWIVQSLSRRSQASLLKVLGMLCPVPILLLALGIHESSLLQLSPVKGAAFSLLLLSFCVNALADVHKGLALALLTVLSLAVGATFATGGLLLSWIVVLTLSCLRLVPKRWGRIAIISVVALVGASLLAPRTGGVAWQSMNPRFEVDHLTRWAIEAKAALRAPRNLPLGGGLGAYKVSINQLKLLGGDVPHPQDQKVRKDSTPQYLISLVESGVGAALFLLLLLGAATMQAWRAGRRGGGSEWTALSLALLALLLAGFSATTLSRGIGVWGGCLLGLSVVGGELPFARRLARLGIPAVYLALALPIAFWVNTPSHAEGNESRISLFVRSAIYGDLVYPFGLCILPSVDSTEEGGIMVEGEAGEVTPPFLVIPARDVSGGRVLSLPANAPKGKGRVVYRVHVPQEGRYRLAASVWW
ncbi:MAG: hypothetical protein ACYTGH_20775, partial [Planctomycetota bacterium]